MPLMIHSKPFASYLRKSYWLFALPVLVIAVVFVVLWVRLQRSRSKPIPTPARQLILYNWVDYMPQSVLDGFEAEYGIHVTYLTYEMEEVAADNIREGNVVFDVAVIDNDDLPQLIAGGQLAVIDYGNVPNFKYISPNFRNLAVDPDNQHSIPYNWGTTGLLVRNDLLDQPVTRWVDLWDARYAGKIGLRFQEYELIGVALKSLGYSINSEDANELAQAGERLLALKPVVQEVAVETEQGVAPLLEGKVWIMVAWPGDALYAKDLNQAIDYILPAEGSMLWGDSFIISAKSRNQSSAELFLNYILRPEVSARIINEYQYSNANEAALKFVKPEIAGNPIISLPMPVMGGSEWYKPLQPKAGQLRDQIWEQFLRANP
jgi:spermidine/putrescine transport system substrate-binding protein